MAAKGAERRFTIAVVLALAAAVGIVAFLVLGSHVAPPRAPGVIEATEIKIAPEISGRLARIAVAPGESVHAGDVLAELSNPELEASLVLAKAQLGEARAARDRVYAGPRQEQVDALQQSVETARADLLYAQQQFARTSKLAGEGVASLQDLDKATAEIGRARASVLGAEEQYQAARLGPTAEQRQVADAEVAKAAAAVSVVAARVAKLQLRAPADATVALLVAELGEAIVPGQPVMTLQSAGQRWASFNLREDQLGTLGVGSPVALLLPGGGNRVAARITEILPRGEFATWRAARAVGDYDLNTFLVRADPAATAAATGLRQGMTVWLEPKSGP
ncbi:MAG TPA: HlyD family efflux transporter periplasmic adaptor subunit [Stellaceae bacterium]|nr:HlyD family efflux transporter periplasmic adaptor subunit [Stellaceae bacterium]